MSTDRTEEYLLVVELRKSVGLVSQKISDATKNDYIRKYERMRRLKKTPESAKCKNGFYAYRAALLYCTALEAKNALNARDKAVYQSSEWQFAMSLLKRCKSIIDRYPPDPERKHCDTGSASFTWSDVRAHRTNCGTSQPVPIKSKKRVLSRLRKIDNWHEKLFDKITHVHKNAAAICYLTGARPSEIAKGVTIQKSGNTRNPMLTIQIKGTKLTAQTGQPERVLRIKADSPEARYLLGQFNGVQSLFITTNPANLTAAVIKAGKKAFPCLKMTVSPYVFRHAISAELKASAISEERIAQTLGHQATKSQQSYGHSAQASGSHNILAVAAELPVRLTHRHPNEVLWNCNFAPSPNYRP